MESLVRGPYLVTPSPPRAESPRCELEVTCIHKVREIQATHTHTANSTTIAAAANTKRDSAREKERGALSSPGSAQEAGGGQP